MTCRLEMSESHASDISVLTQTLQHIYTTLDSIMSEILTALKGPTHIEAPTVEQASPSMAVEQLFRHLKMSSNLNLSQGARDDWRAAINRELDVSRNQQAAAQESTVTTIAKVLDPVQRDWQALWHSLFASSSYKTVCLTDDNLVKELQKLESACDDIEAGMASLMQAEKKRSRDEVGFIDKWASK
jgi:hypothetical protein